MAYTLRPYQQQAVAATLTHFRQTDDAAVIVLPTGSGKSLVISELASLARHKILVLAHVKELVEQNHDKYQSYGLTAGIYSAGLGRKQLEHQVTFASIQSAAPNLADFSEYYSLVIIDECHRIGLSHDGEQSQSNDNNKDKEKKKGQNQYQQLISQLKKANPKLKVLGLTATPFRLGSGWIYQRHYHGFIRTEEPRPFVDCIYEMPLALMIKQHYLTPPTLIDATIAHYDFSSLNANKFGNYPAPEVNSLLTKHARVTQAIIEQVVELSAKRRGVMIFAATTDHAREIIGYLEDSDCIDTLNHQSAAMILGDTPNHQRDQIIHDFKQQKIKYLVNVAVLTTGFDAPHVDFIALLRPTQSLSLFQQIVGRGLRLAPDKQDCLIIDYAGSGFDIYSPEVGSAKPSSDSVPVLVPCPICQFGNTFWGKVSEDNQIIEHYGRRCWGYELNEQQQKVRCDYRFRFKECSQCGAENDIAARRCCQCQHAIIDPDQLLKNALKLKDAMVLRCSGMLIEPAAKGDNRIKVSYVDEDGATVSEQFNFSHKTSRELFNQQFGRRSGQGTQPQQFDNAAAVLAVAQQLIAPDFVIARKQNHYWQIKEKVFDYQGNYRKANQLS